MHGAALAAPCLIAASLLGLPIASRTHFFAAGSHSFFGSCLSGCAEASFASDGSIGLGKEQRVFGMTCSAKTYGPPNPSMLGGRSFPSGVSEATQEPNITTFS